MMLELARVLAGKPGVLVAALGAEERAVTGSAYHLGSLRLLRSLDAAERDTIKLALSLDMVGVGPTLNVRGIEASPSRPRARLLRQLPAGQRAIGSRRDVPGRRTRGVARVALGRVLAQPMRSSLPPRPLEDVPGGQGRPPGRPHDLRGLTRRPARR